MNFEYCEGRVHVIEEGDTLYQLSRQHNVPLALILRANPFTDVYNLQIGDEICIPTMIGRPPERPEMPEMPNRPGMGMPDRPNMLGRPGMGMPDRPNMPGTPGMGMPNMPNMQQVSDGMQTVPNGMGGALGRPDRTITMPQFPNLFTYTVENEDSLEDILDEFEISLEDLLNFNDLEDIMLLPGSVVKVPVRRQRED